VNILTKAAITKTYLVIEEREIACELIVCGDDKPFSTDNVIVEVSLYAASQGVNTIPSIELWTSCSTKYLHHVQHAELYKRTILRIIYLSSYQGNGQSTMLCDWPIARIKIKPLMITVCAGRLTPQARVAVQTSTFKSPCENSFSTRLRSALSIPAWWMPTPFSNNAFSSLFLDLPTSLKFGLLRPIGLSSLFFEGMYYFRAFSNLVASFEFCGLKANRSSLLSSSANLTIFSAVWLQDVIWLLNKMEHNSSPSLCPYEHAQRP